MEPMSRPPSSPGPNGHKKALLQKLMDNLLTKPGRSMHEIINGVKSAIGAYKNYAKEWDNLNGMGTAVGGAAGGSSGGSSGGIQSILKDVQVRKAKDGGGGPGNFPTGNPNGMPTQARGIPALGNPQQRPTMMPLPPSVMPITTPRVQTPQTVTPPATGLPPMSPMPDIPPIAGQPQTSNFNRPAPVSNLGIWGH